MKNKQKTFNLVITGLMLAIVIVMGAIPNLGYIMIGAISVTLVHIPTIVAGITTPKKYSWIVGLAFGISSLIQAFSYLGANAPFTNPIVSVLPRVALPLFASFIYCVYSKKMSQYIAVPLTCITSTLFHTVTVLVLYVLCGNAGFYFYAASNACSNSFMTLLATILSFNTLLEAGVCTVIGTLVIIAIEKSMRIKNFLPENNK